MSLWKVLVGLALIGSLASIAWAQAPPAGTPPPATQPAPAQEPPAAAQTPPAAATQAPPAEATPPAAAATTPAVTPPAATGPEGHIEGIKQSLASSAAALKSYEWMQTVALSLKGEEKSRKDYKCSYGADGKVQKTPVANAATEEQKKKKGLRGKAVANKMEEIQATLKAATELMDQYSPLDPAKIQAAKAAGNLSVSVPGADNRVRVTIKNYLKQGDVVEVEVDGAKNTLQGVTITSAMDQGDVKGPVTAKVTYAALADGTMYTIKQVLDMKAQSLKVDVDNSAYTKKAS